MTTSWRTLPLRVPIASGEALDSWIERLACAAVMCRCGTCGPSSVSLSHASARRAPCSPPAPDHFVAPGMTRVAARQLRDRATPRLRRLWRAQRTAGPTVVPPVIAGIRPTVRVGRDSRAYTIACGVCVGPPFPPGADDLLIRAGPWTAGTSSVGPPSSTRTLCPASRMPAYDHRAGSAGADDDAVKTRGHRLSSAHTGDHYRACCDVVLYS